MDINQSPLSRYKTNKSGTPQTPAEAKAMAEATKSKEASGSSASLSTKPLELKEGQVLKGQILDHRYNEVKVQLEPGKQTVTAKLSGDVPLSIGQEAKFVVTEESSDHLVLKYLPEETAAPADSVVLKALTASNLPVTDRNKSIASELLSQRMPVDKQTLQLLIKMSVTNREASPLTLVLMLKNNIPMTPENIRQFEAYQSGTHQLLNDIRTISQKAADILGHIQTLQADLPVHNQPEQFSYSGNPNEATVKHSYTDGLQPKTSYNTNPAPVTPVQVNGELIKILYGLVANENQLSTAPVQLSSVLNQAELTQLTKVIAQKMAGNPALSSGLPSDLLHNINNGTLSMNDTIKLIARLYSADPGSPESQLQQEIFKQAKLQDQTNPMTNQIIAKLLDRSAKLQDNSPSLSKVLSSDDRTALLNYLPDVSDTDPMKSRIAQGAATLKETLSFFQESLAHSDGKSAVRLFHAPEYSKLLEEAFLQKWTITPEKLAEKEPVQELYRQLREDLDRISSLAKSVNTTEEMLRIQEPVKNMQENLQFMKDLNEVYTYLQLPVQLKDHEAHTDLYVLTRKKALNDKKENLSVLLHLDMTNLGSLNVHIQMHNNQIQADFYIEKPETGHLIKENLPSLTAALENKGYLINTEVKDTYKKPDFSKDFIEQNSRDNFIQRYTFDIRT